MRWKWLTPMLLLGLFAVAFPPRPALAQRKGPARPPAVTPFLALGGNNGMNYFTITRPTLDTRTLQSRQEAEINKIDQKLQGRTSPGLTATGEFEVTLPKTGHRTYFSNTSHYYPSVKPNQ